MKPAKPTILDALNELIGASENYLHASSPIINTRNTRTSQSIDENISRLLKAIRNARQAREQNS